MDADITSAAFQLAHPTKQIAHPQKLKVLHNGDIAIVRLEAIHPATNLGNVEKRNVFSRQFANNIGDLEYNLYTESVLAQADIEHHN